MITDENLEKFTIKVAKIIKDNFGSDLMINLLAGCLICGYATRKFNEEIDFSLKQLKNSDSLSSINTDKLEIFHKLSYFSAKAFDSLVDYDFELDEFLKN